MISARTNFLTSNEHQRILCSSFAYPQDPPISRSYLSTVQPHFITPSHILCPVAPLDVSFFTSSDRNRWLPFHAYLQKTCDPVWSFVCLWVPRFAFSNYGIPSPPTRSGYVLFFSLSSLCLFHVPSQYYHVRCTFKYHNLFFTCGPDEQNKKAAGEIAINGHFDVA